MDVFEKCQPSDDLTKLHNFARKLRQDDPYPYFIPFNKKGGQFFYRDLPLKMFGSNDYLGLSTDQRVLDAYCKAANEFGTGCTGSRFLNGTNTLHVDLEQRLAAFLGKDDALAFSNGFLTCMGTIASLCDGGTILIYDRNSHASIIQGALTIPIRNRKRFRHNDVGALDLEQANFPVVGEEKF